VWAAAVVSAELGGTAVLPKKIYKNCQETVKTTEVKETVTKNDFSDAHIVIFITSVAKLSDIFVTKSCRQSLSVPADVTLDADILAVSDISTTKYAQQNAASAIHSNAQMKRGLDLCKHGPVK